MSRIDRRTMLRGAGAAVGLPLLEAMRPRRVFASGDGPPTRLVFVYKPGGAVMPDWTPTAEGAGFDLPYILQPLASVRRRVLVLSGLDGRNGEQGANGHPLACAPWLSSAPLNKRDRGGYATDVSVDQLAADRIGRGTRLPSLELGTRHSSTSIHESNVSWRGPGSPMGKEVDPRAVFARLFGDARGDRHRRSILDAVREDARGLEGRLGADDRRKLDEYLDSIRSIERRMEAVERAAPAAPPDLRLPDAPPATHTELVNLLLDLLALGLRADATRVATLMLSNEDQIPPLPELSVREDHHGLAHNDSRPGRPAVADRDKVEKLRRIDRHYVSLFARFLERLAATAEDDGTLLDRCLIVYGSGLSWGNLHIRTDLPVLLAGGGGGTIRPGRHVRYPRGTPLANLFLSLLDRVGVERDRIADSTGRLPDLA